MKTKTILGIMIFAILMIGAYFAYGTLSDKFAPNNEMVGVRPPENTEPQLADTSLTTSETSQDTKISAPDFTVTDNDGNEVKFSVFSGKPVVINFWASWCPPCKSEMPHFGKVYEDVNDDVQFLMVDLVDGQRETVEKGKKYVNDSGYTFPVYFDTAQDAANAFGITYIPTTVFIDKDGNVVTGYQGAINEETLRKGIEMITNAITQKSEYHKISADEAKKMLDENKDVILLDVRTESEYKDKHIPNAVLIPDYEIADRAAELPDKNAVILIYCRSGNRSKTAANVLVDMGYMNVYDFGGINSWPYETE